MSLDDSDREDGLRPIRNARPEVRSLSAGQHVNLLTKTRCAVGSACDGIVTGIQIKARAGDIAAYRIIKKPLKNRRGCNLF
jgi:hypothetical protein